MQCNLQTGLFFISGVTPKGSQHHGGRVGPWVKQRGHRV
jgi:hypothetical protein